MKIPKPKYDKKRHNNPVWVLPANLPVERMDNSLSLQQHLATFKFKGKTFNVSLALGGLVFIVNAAARNGRPFAIDMAEFIVGLAPLIGRLDKSAKPRPHPKSVREAASQ